jgi:hypothetical protein
VGLGGVRGVNQYKGEGRAEVDAVSLHNHLGAPAPQDKIFPAINKTQLLQSRRGGAALSWPSFATHHQEKSQKANSNAQKNLPQANESGPKNSYP